MAGLAYGKTRAIDANVPCLFGCRFDVVGDAVDKISLRAVGAVPS
jgi:hypothetical protein